MKRRGIARGKFRLDGSSKWPILDMIRKPQAEEARERMLARETMQPETPCDRDVNLTDEVVNGYMGGRDGAAKQSAAYKGIMDNIKAGKGVKEPAGSLAEVARKRMIERQEQNAPDIGRDRANRRAYPAESNKR